MNHLRAKKTRKISLFLIFALCLIFVQFYTNPLFVSAHDPEPRSPSPSLLSTSEPFGAAESDYAVDLEPTVLVSNYRAGTTGINRIFLHSADRTIRETRKTCVYSETGDGTREYITKENYNEITYYTENKDREIDVDSQTAIEKSRFTERVTDILDPRDKTTIPAFFEEKVKASTYHYPNGLSVSEGQGEYEETNIFTLTEASMGGSMDWKEGETVEINYNEMGMTALQNGNQNKHNIWFMPWDKNDYQYPYTTSIDRESFNFGDDYDPRDFIIDPIAYDFYHEVEPIQFASDSQNMNFEDYFIQKWGLEFADIDAESFTDKTAVGGLSVYGNMTESLPYAVMYSSSQLIGKYFYKWPIKSPYTVWSMDWGSNFYGIQNETIQNTMRHVLSSQTLFSEHGRTLRSSGWYPPERSSYSPMHEPVGSYIFTTRHRTDHSLGIQQNYGNTDTALDQYHAKNQYDYGMIFDFDVDLQSYDYEDVSLNLRASSSSRHLGLGSDINAEDPHLQIFVRIDYRNGENLVSEYIELPSNDTSALEKGKLCLATLDLEDYDLLNNADNIEHIAVGFRVHNNYKGDLSLDIDQIYLSTEYYVNYVSQGMYQYETNLPFSLDPEIGLNLHNIDSSEKVEVENGMDKIRGMDIDLDVDLGEYGGGGLGEIYGIDLVSVQNRDALEAHFWHDYAYKPILRIIPNEDEANENIEYSYLNGEGYYLLKVPHDNNRIHGELQIRSNNIRFIDAEGTVYSLLETVEENSQFLDIAKYEGSYLPYIDIVKALSETLYYHQSFGQNYNLLFRLEHLGGVNAESVQVSFNYIDTEILLYGSNTAQRKVFLDYNNEGNIFYQYDVPLEERYSQSTSDITIVGVGKSWEIDAYQFVQDGETETEGLTFTEKPFFELEEITFNDPSESMISLQIDELPSETTSVRIVLKGINYLEGQTLSQDGLSLVKTDNSDNTKEILSTNQNEFFENGRMRLSIEPKEISGDDTGFFTPETTPMLKHEIINHVTNEVTFTHDIYPEIEVIDGVIETQDFTFDVSLSGKVQEGNAYDHFLIYVSDIENPLGMGWKRVDSAFSIRENYIRYPTYDFDETDIYYSFTTKAETEYSAIVFQTENYGINYEKEAEYISGVASDNIVLDGISVTNHHIKGEKGYEAFANPHYELEFSNTGESELNVIIDRIAIIPYFYSDSLQTKTLFEKTNFDAVAIPTVTPQTVEIVMDFEGCNLPRMRGAFTTIIEFHQEGSDSASVEVGDLLISEIEMGCIGTVYDYEIFTELDGEEVIQGSFSKNEDSNQVVCYIMDSEGYGTNTYQQFQYEETEGNENMYYNNHRFYYANQYTPEIDLVYPSLEQDIIFKTSYVQVSSYITDQNEDINTVKIHLYDPSSDFEIEWQDYTQVDDSTTYYEERWNPFEMVTTTFTCEIEVVDFNLNYAYLSFPIRVESYKEVEIETQNIQYGKVNAYPTQDTVNCRLPLDYSSLDSESPTIYVDLGSDFADAKDYYIQRSPIDIYYPQDDAGNGITPNGKRTYWYFNEFKPTDMLYFELNSPIAFWEKDFARSSLEHQEFYVRFKRHLNIRNYSDVSVVGSISMKPQDITVRIIDQTGGNNISLKSHQIQYTFDSRLDVLHVNFTLNHLQEGTDYQYKLILDTNFLETLEQQSQWIDLLLGALGGAVIGGGFRYGLSYLGEKLPRFSRFRSFGSDLTKKMAVFGVIGAIGGLAFGYFVW